MENNEKPKEMVSGQASPEGQTEPNSEQGGAVAGSGKMKMIIKIAVLVVIFFLLKDCAWGCANGVSGKNIKFGFKTDNSVDFNTICPKCKHVSEGLYVEMSPGEDTSGYDNCNKCGHMFEYSVKRNW